MLRSYADPLGSHCNIHEEGTGIRIRTFEAGAVGLQVARCTRWCASSCRPLNNQKSDRCFAARIPARIKLVPVIIAEFVEYNLLLILYLQLDEYAIWHCRRISIAPDCFNIWSHPHPSSLVFGRGPFLSSSSSRDVAHLGGFQIWN